MGEKQPLKAKQNIKEAKGKRNEAELKTEWPIWGKEWLGQVWITVVPLPVAETTWNVKYGYLVLLVWSDTLWWLNLCLPDD